MTSREDTGLWPCLLKTIMETTILGRLFVLDLNLLQGNITPDEYEEALKSEKGAMEYAQEKEVSNENLPNITNQ